MAQVASETTLARERRLRMSYEEFLASELSEGHAEWVDGEVIVFMPANTRHARVVRFLSHLLVSYVDALALGEVFMAPFEMRLARSAREPDILFVVRDHLDRVDEQRLVGAADLAVEVISDESVSRDRAHKHYEYEEAGVAEYLLIDPRPKKERTELFRLDAEGMYQPVPPDEHGRLHFETIPGFWIDRAWLLHDPLPNLQEVLAEIAPEYFGRYKRAPR
ncbi:MAG: Uma2 family endonuclease [Thermomicrobiales bacterium]